MTQYPEDEFDRAARDRGPKGVHRPAEPTWKKFLPLLVALVVGPLLAWAAISALNRDNPVPEAGPTTPVESTTAVEPTEAVETTAPAEPTETAEPEPVINYEAPVVVYNGARVAGIAGRVSERVTELGFTQVTADNYTAEDPADSTVFYNNAELADTAAAVAEGLGIANVTENAEAAESISVILRPDFQE